MANTIASNDFGITIQGHVPHERFVKKTVAIDIVSDVVTNVAEAIVVNLESLGYTGPIDSDSVSKALETMFRLRVQQVSKVKPVSGFRITDYRIWTFVFPMLAQIGIFRNEKDGYEIYPALSGAQVTADDIDHMNNVVRALAYWGLSYAMGLPKDIETESDDIYRLAIDNGTVLGSERVPGPVSVMTRMFFSLQALNDLYGGNRVAYTTIRFLQQVFIDHVSKQMKNPSSIKT